MQAKSLDWSDIVRKQDEFTYEEDRKKQKQKLILKQLYKAELLSMIKGNAKAKQQELNIDSSIIKLQSEKEKARIMKEQQEKQKKQKEQQEIAKWNYEVIAKRKKNIQQQIEENNKFYASRFQKSMSEAKQQQQSKILKQSSTKEELSKSYESQILEQQIRKSLQKMEDRKFAEMSEQIQRKKEQNRRLFFNRLHTYGQNPQVYEQSKSLIIQAQLDRNVFLNKLENDDRSLKEYKEKQIKEQQKIQQIQNIGKFNKNYFQNKSLRDRMHTMEETNDYHRRFLNLEQQLQEQRYRKLQEKQEKKRILKQELEKQIEQNHLKDSRKYKLTQKEQKINKSGQIAVLPGISSDYSSEKHKKILFHFLGGSTNIVK